MLAQGIIQEKPSDALPPVTRQNDRLAVWLILGQILGATLLQKFAVPFGEAQLFFSFFLMGAMTAIGVLTGRLEVRPSVLAGYLLMVSVLILTQLLGVGEFSSSSLSLLIVMHGFYVFGLGRGFSEPGSQFLLFRKIITVCAVLGIVQYILQFIIGADYAFLLDTMLPESIVQQGFNDMNAVTYKGSIYKSTGFFFLEPAIFSQFLAIGIIVEVVYFKSIPRILLLFAAIAVTFSGTGLILLFIFLPVYLIQQKKFLILLLGMLAVLSAPLWAPLVGLERTVDRASEFGRSNSSAYARFFSMIPTLENHAFTDDTRIAFGNGAGSILRLFHGGLIDYEVFNPSWGKMVFEYGIVGFLAYFLFMGFVLFRSGASLYVKMSLLLAFLFLGEYVLSPVVHGLILALLVWPSRQEAADKNVSHQEDEEAVNV